MSAVPGLPVFDVVVTTLPAAGYSVRLAASDEDLRAMAGATDVEAFEQLQAEVTVRRWRRDGAQVSGRVHAVVVQPCIVSLEPVRQVIEEDFASTFVPHDSKLAKPSRTGEGEILLDPEGEDAPEIFEGDSIDVWSVVAEWLNLAIDRFPRAPGAELAMDFGMTDAGEDKVKPFSALARLKRGED